MRKVDILNHIMPARFFERIGDCKDIGKRMREGPMLYDLDERFPGDGPVPGRSWTLWKTKALAKLESEKRAR